ncbi:hypothetical protein H6501_03180 [Candidatus Woesearchaeota archaeon]|nr:hypothetical protein [Nanoarchaeota archaeon]MCB9370573.1 hypothetical protein [Candidatus Woesearchaeota archaeon]USN43655.1 MAG: hypothetical protein H6500_04665 [Candidatus Woesearchaeota archaeon]
MAEEIAIRVLVPTILGIGVGLIEAYFVYEDENMGGLQGFFGKVWHGILFSIIGVLIATNVAYFLSQGWVPSFLEGLLFMDDVGRSFTASLLIALVMFIKIDLAHRVRGISGTGFIEKPWHKMAVACLIGFSPYYISAFDPFFAGLQEVIPWLPL